MVDYSKSDITMISSSSMERKFLWLTQFSTFYQILINILNNRVFKRETN